MTYVPGKQLRDNVICACLILTVKTIVLLPLRREDCICSVQTSLVTKEHPLTKR
jgi:hypothetical protein